MNQADQNRLERDQKEIDQLTDQFFDLFTNTHNRTPPLGSIKDMFLAKGLLINNTAIEPAIYNLDSFIKPRQEILTNGTLTDFTEQEVSSNTIIMGNIAQRTCQYKKSGKLNREAFVGGGNKLMQFVKYKDKWMLSSVLWSDEK